MTKSTAGETLRPGRLGWLALALLLLALPAHADLAAWDQARVTTIAKGLAEACDGWEQTVRDMPGQQLGSGSANEEFDMVQESRRLREQSAALAGHLAKGDGYDKTRHLYDALKEGVDDTTESASRAALDEPTLDAWSKVADSMRQIAPYYDPKALEGAGAGD